ncbi:CPBP family glutamic-type intramembrane protease [Polaribacter sp. AHE13PA]|jgi:hypothetical protein|uniref:CPBP family glutamic-type intramembrane protease n=1 Tax=Polaribacter sp. AHE13PA TaxID=2745562 RepID=UPI001C4F7959|nr:CPBP family glutamic-type intramembrane protease [Polaribacter sp. AHE13PA]QXP68469.1 CPBP family intramembrane metalloprotease [Polaribacter sp. AHE13PA]
MKKTSIRKDLFRFLKKPNFDKLQDVSIKTKVIILFKILILTYIGLIIANLPFQILKELSFVSETTNKVNVFLDTMRESKSEFKPYYIFTSILLIPLFEETAFRLFLTKFKLNYFIISISLILGVLIKHFMNFHFWKPKSYLLLAVSSYIYIIIISAIIGLVLWRIKNQLIRIEKFWNNNIGLIFYSSAILFALFHFMTTNFDKDNLIFAPLILLPFLVYGLTFSYVRIRLGLIYSMTLHLVVLGILFGLPELITLLKK